MEMSVKCGCNEDSEMLVIMCYVMKDKDNEWFYYPLILSAEMEKPDSRTHGYYSRKAKKSFNLNP